jgi:phospholipid/cholesterol/gamma-HCH transport system substrate-binding protein
MPDILARGTAVIVAGLLAVAVAALFVTSRPPSGADEVKAEFDSAFPLVEGMHVRVDGAIAGSVGEIEVNDRGNAVVNLVLTESIEPARADATASIRQQDTTGDSYIAYDPGVAAEPLGPDGITCEDWQTCDRTLVAPRLDDLVNAFGPGEQAGIKLILTETAKALDRRGADVNAAALALKPALTEANQALAEVNSQNEALKRLVESAENVTRQSAEKEAELARLVESLPQLLEATAAESAALDADLEALPETAEQAHSTLSALNRAVTPLASVAGDLREGAPEFASALDRLTPFLQDASAWIDDQTPTLELTRGVLKAAEPSLEIGKKRVITGAFDLTGATADLLNTVLGGEDAFPALFGDDSYGVGEGTLGKRGFGAVAVEPGDLLGYPASHAPRNWLRVSGVFNCEIFGRPVEPGCLAGVLEGLPGRSEAERSRDADRARERQRRERSEPARAYAQPSEGGLLDEIALPKVPKLDLSALVPQLDLPGPLGEPRQDDPSRGRGGLAGGIKGIIDFLFKP